MADSIEYELVEWQPKEVWKCQGTCGRFRHRNAVPDIFPAICCDVEARFIDRHEQPVAFVNVEPLKDEGIELIMAQMQAYSLALRYDSNGSCSDPNEDQRACKS